MSISLSYNHGFWKALRASHVFSKWGHIAALRKISIPLSYNQCFWESLRGSHVLLKTISHNWGECQPFSTVIIVLQNHCGARMYFCKRFRIAALRKMSTPLSYNQCIRESLRASHVLWKRGHITTLRKISTPRNYNQCFRESMRGLHLLLKTISHNIIEEHVHPS